MKYHVSLLEVLCPSCYHIIGRIVGGLEYIRLEGCIHVAGEICHAFPLAVLFVVLSDYSDVEEAWNKDAIGHGPLIPAKKSARTLAKEIINFFEFSWHVVFQLLVQIRIAVLDPHWEHWEHLACKEKRTWLDKRWSEKSYRSRSSKRDHELGIILQLHCLYMYSCTLAFR